VVEQMFSLGLAEGGVAILDRGLPARELTGNTPVLVLLNGHDIYLGYRNSWMSGNPKIKSGVIPWNAT
jgi:hypothetical protein